MRRNKKLSDLYVLWGEGNKVRRTTGRNFTITICKLRKIGESQMPAQHGRSSPGGHLW